MNNRQILRGVLVATGWTLLGVAHQLHNEPRIIAAAIFLFVMVVVDFCLIASDAA